MSDMFNGASSFEGSSYGIEQFNTSSVTNMDRMFYNATSFSNHDLSGWDVRNVTSHEDFLKGAGTGNIKPNWP
jgi:surface protein